MNLRIKSIISQISRSLSISLPLTIGIELVSNLQIIYIILKNIFTDNQLKQDLPSKFLEYISSTIGAHGISSMTLDNLLILWIWIFIACYLTQHIVLIVIIIVSQQRYPDINWTKLHKGIAFMYLLHSRVFFFIIHYFFMGIISSYSNCSLMDSENFSCQPVCFGFSIIFCIINVGLGIGKEFFFYDIAKNKKNTYAIKSNFFHKTVLFYKTVTVVILLLPQNPDLANKLASAINLCFTLVALVILYVKLPFYNIKVLRTSVITSGINLSFSIMSLFGALIADKNVLGAIWIILTPLLIKSLMLLFNVLSKRIMQGKFLSPARAIYFVAMLERYNFGYSPASFYSEPKIKTGRLICNGLFIQKNMNRTDMDNPCQSKKEYEERVYTHILEKLTLVLEKNPKSEVLILFMAQIYLKKLWNIPKASNLIKRLEPRNFSIPLRNSLEFFHAKASEFYRKNQINNDKDSLNLAHYFENRKISNAIKEIIQQEVNDHLEFWQEIRKNKMDVEKIIHLASQIDSISSKVLNKWESQIAGSNKHFLNSFIMYGAYLEIVKEDQEEAKRFLTEFGNLGHNIREDQMYDVYSDKAAAVLISIQKTNFGIIVDASGSAQALFSVDKHMLIGQSIKSLFPSIAGDDLFRHLVRYAHRLTGKLDYNPKSFAKAENGDIFEIEIELKLYPESDGQMKVVILFKKLAVPKPIMIVDSRGLIAECSESLKKALFLPHQEKNVGFTDLKKIALGFNRVNSAFNMIYGLNIDITKSQSTIDATTNPMLSRNKPVNDRVYMPNIKATTQENIDKQKNTYQVVTSAEVLEQEEAKQICNEFLQGARLTFINPNLRRKKVYNVQISPFYTNDNVYKIISFVLTKDKRIPSKNFGSKKISSVFDEALTDFAAEFSEVDERKFEDKESLQQELAGNNKSKKFYLDVKDFNKYNGLCKRPCKDESSDSGTIMKKEASNSHEVIAPLQVKVDNQYEGFVQSSYRQEASLRALKVVFEKARPYSLGKKISWMLFVLLLVHIGLTGSSYNISHSAISQVETSVQVINLASLRLSQAIRGWQTATRFFLRYNQLVSGKVQTIKNNINSNGLGMLTYNKELMKRFSSNADDDFIRATVKGVIQLWEPEENLLISGDKMDTFEATNLLARKMITVGTSSQDITAPLIVESVRFVANNTGNEYLLASEELIVNTQGVLDTLIKSNITRLYLVLGIEVAALGAIFVCLVYAVRSIVKLYKKLFGALSKIDHTLVRQLQKVKLLLDEDLERKQFIQNALEALKINDEDKTHAKEEVKFAKKNTFHQRTKDRIVTKGLLKSLFKSMCVSLVVIQTIMAFFVGSLVDSISNFESLQDRNTQLSVVTRAGYQTSAIFGTFYTEIVWGDNSSMLVRNDIPSKQLIKNLQAISNLNQEIISVFSSKGNSISDPLIKEMLQGTTLCTYLSSTVQDYCQNATANGNLGLLSVNSKLLIAMEYYISRFLDNPDYNITKSYFDEYLTLVRPCGDTLDEAYHFINSHILDGLHEDLQSFMLKTNAFHLAILFAIILSTVFIRKVSIQRLEAVDMCRGLILKAVSFKILHEDQAIKLYLNKHFISKKSISSPIY